MMIMLINDVYLDDHDEVIYHYNGNDFWIRMEANVIQLMIDIYHPSSD